MNKIYRLKYDRRRNQLVAVSELTTGAGKETTGQTGVPADAGTFRKFTGTLTPLAFLAGLVMSFLPGMALANPDLPTGGQIVQGQGSISTSAGGNQMTINQTTHGLVTNWNTFDVGQNHTVQFVQPDSSAVALNRVTGGHESQILGTLTANGQVMLVNPAGVMFGKGAKVNTAGLLASTKNISNADFMAGRYTFSGGSQSGAEVVNQGNLTTTKGGYIVLAADRVKNSGDISTPGGKTVLAAGDRVTLQLDNTGLASVSVSGSVVNALVENSGLLSATNGRVYLTARGKDMLLNTVVNNSGTIEAKGLNSRGGEIVLDGGDSGVVSQSGRLLADSAAGRGGKITVEGENIHLAANSRTSATGRTGGGEVYVGGGWQGKDSRIHNASKVVMDRTASVDVSATEDGNGGTAVLWSEDYTNFRGTILAKGGSRSGNGGQVETSSHNNLQAYGDADASAPAGKGGNWLLDPLNIEIINGRDESEPGPGGIFTPTGDNAKVSNASIQKQLNDGTSVTISTSAKGGTGGDITVNADIQKTGDKTASLTLDADRSIIIGNNNTQRTISSSKGKLNVYLYGAGSQNGTINLSNNAKIESHGGNIVLGRKDAGTDHSLNIVSNNAVLDATTGGTVGATAGDITLKTEISSDTGPAVNLTGSTFKGNKIEINGTTNTGGSGVKLTSNHLEAAGDLNIKGDIQKEGGGYGVNVASAAKANEFIGKNIAITATARNGSDGALHLEGGNFTASETSLSGTATEKGTGVGITGSTTVKGNLSVSGETGSIKVSSGAKIETTEGDLTMKGPLAVDAGKGKTTTIKSAGDLNISAESGNLIFNTGNAPGSSLLVEAAGGVNIQAKVGQVAMQAGLMNENSGISVNSGDGKEVSLYGNAVGGGTIGLLLSNVKILSGGDVFLTGLTDSGPRTAMKIVGSKITSTKDDGKISLDGTTAGDSEKSSGIRVEDKSVFSAKTLKVQAVANKGTGFTITDSSFTGDTLTVSSSGSASDVTNVLGNGIVTEQNKNSFFSSYNPENLTTIGLSDMSIPYDVASGWTADFTRPDTNAGWIFEHAKVDAGGTVNLKGAGFKNSTITVNKGDFILNNTTGPVTLDSTGVDVTNGGVELNSASGGISLSGGSITAKKDINLTSNGGTIAFSGHKIHTSDGNVNVISENTGNKHSISMQGTDITSVNGEIHFEGEGNGGAVQPGYPARTAILFKGENSFASKRNVIHGKNLGEYNSAYGIALNDYDNDLSFFGNTEFNGSSDYGGGVLVMGGRDDKITSTKIKISNGTLDLNAVSGINADTKDTASGTAAITMGNFYQPVNVIFNLDNAAVNINATALSDERVPAFAGATNATWETANGFIFNGNGDVFVKGTANGGNGVNTRYFNNTDLDGSFSLTGISEAGNGINIEGARLNTTLVNATLTGISNSGNGVVINSSGNGRVELNNNTVTGTSNTADGININGNNVTIANGSLEGKVTAGNGTGVSMTGGNNYTLNDVIVTGTALDGSGIHVNGTLTVNKATTLSGTATTGAGVSLGEGGTIVGGTVKAHSVRGTGFKAGSGSTLDGVSVKGTTADGVGVDVSDLQERKGGTTITGEATGHGTSVQTEHDDGSRPDVVPPAPGGDTGKPATPDTTPPAGGDTDKHDSSAPELKPGTAEAVRQYIYEKQGVLSQPERLMNTVRVSGLRERSEPVNVEICTEGQCRQLDVGTVNGPARP